MKKYTKDMPRRLYSFFASCEDGTAAPSFSKFARSIGSTLSEIEGWRKNKTFDSAWRECIEIRRDYLTDCALTRRYDSSFVKFLLGFEIDAELNTDEEKSVAVTVTVEKD